MAIKLDLGKAWEDAVAMLNANKDVVLIMAAVFFFLPGAISGIIAPEPTELNAMLASGAQPDPDEVANIFLAYIADVWWIYLLASLFSAIGMLGLYALLRSTRRPTVGEAIAIAVKSLPTYIAVLLLTSVIFAIVIMVPIMLGALISPAVAALLSLVGFAVMVYVYVKLSLTSPIIAIDGVMNPLTAMIGSWKMTKGNSLRLFAFYMLLFLSIIVLSLLVNLLLSAFAIFGDQIGLFAIAIGGSLFSMVTTSVLLAVVASAHRQLSGDSRENLAETFD